MTEDRNTSNRRQRMESLDEKINTVNQKNANTNRRKKREVNEEKDLLREILGMVIYCAGILLAAFLLVTFVAQRTGVIGESMCDTLQNGDNLIVDKISYRFHDPERFDIIVFPAPDNAEKNYIKRIIGLPGETVQIIGDSIYINDELLSEDYGREKEIHYTGVAAEPIVLGEDEYFVLGDNRNDSKDSRYEIVGNIRRDEIIGRAWIRIWPLKSIGVLKHQ